MITNTRGRVALGEYLAGDGAMTQTEIASILQVKQPSISNWLRGLARPEPHLRTALERLIGIPASDWQTKKEARDERDALERIARHKPSKPAA